MDTWAIITIAVVVIIALIIIVWAAIHGRSQKPVYGAEGMIGETAVVQTPLNPSGTVFVEGESWKATLEQGEIVETGEEVTVIRVDGLKLIVTKKK
jgi:membrane-bound serine protease (ClpP class)